jgi:hypothetical protein
VGVNLGTISNSTAFVTLTATLTDSATNLRHQSTQIGAIAGRNDAAITNVSAAGTISVELNAAVSTRAVFGAQIGGLVGLSDRGSNIALSSSTVNISAAFSGSAYALAADNPYTSYWNAIGGLVGNAPSTSTIADSFSSGVITVTNAVKPAGGVPRDTIGGLLGSGGIIGPGADVSPAGTPTITGSSASGPIKATGLCCSPFGASLNVGGLVGQFSGTINSSYASGSLDVTGEGFNAVGGLVGQVMSGALTHVKASGSVTSVDRGLGVDIGGLAGTNGAVVTNAISSGVVSSSLTLNLPPGMQQGSTIGGLAGFNYGVIRNALALGSVTATFAGSVSGSGSFYGDTVAGLVANNAGRISNSSAWGQVSLASTLTTSSGGASDKMAGGLVGGGYVTSFGTSNIDNSFAMGGVSASGVNDRLLVGALMGYNKSLIASSYALGKLSVQGGTETTIGGLVGRNDIGSSITSSYWDINRTGLTIGVGSGTATGATSWSGAPAAIPAGFDLAAWGLTPTVDSGYPCLLWHPVCAAQGSLPDSDRIFNFAEAMWPQFFGIASPPSATAEGYYYRFYNKTGFYLATKAGEMYLCWMSLSPLYRPTGPGHNVFGLGPVSWWLATARSAGF